PLARLPRESAARRRTHHGRGPPSPPREPDRLLSGPEGAAHQVRRLSEHAEERVARSGPAPAMLAVPAYGSATGRNPGPLATAASDVPIGPTTHRRSRAASRRCRVSPEQAP